MKLKDYHENLRPFIFHGVELDNDPTEARGVCPFCDKPGRFHVLTATGQWSCKRCGEGLAKSGGGNIYGFLAKLQALAASLTEPENYETLAHERNTSPAVLRLWGFGRSPITGDWLVPARNTKNRIANLHRVSLLKGKLRALGTPGCKPHPFGPLPKKVHSELYWCEGVWDGMALHHALRTVALRKEQYGQTADPRKSLAAHTAVMACPGANVFDANWSLHFAGRNCFILYHNDHPKQMPASQHTFTPGWDGQQRVIKITAQASPPPASLHQLRWGGDRAEYDRRLKDGYDLRDMIGDHGAVVTIKNLQNMTQEAALPSYTPSRPGTILPPKSEATKIIEPSDCDSFEKLCRIFGSNLHFTVDMQDTLSVMLAVVISTTLDGDQIWLRVIGPPGSGKSTLAEAISAAHEHVFPVSNVRGFHSGYTHGSGVEGNEDASLIPMMMDRTVIIKDADTLVNAPSRDQIMSELRDIYDGVSRAHYRNRKHSVYEGIHTTIILCGTDELRSLNRTLLGERFLDCDIFGLADRSKYLDRAFRNAYQRVTSSLLKDNLTKVNGHIHFSDKEEHILDLEAIRSHTVGFINHLKEELHNTQAPIMPTAMKQSIESLSDLLSFMRAKVIRDKESQNHRSRIELPTRLVSQFVKLSVCLPIVMAKTVVDTDVLRVLRKVFLDTCEGLQLDITRLLMQHREGMTSEHIAVATKISTPTVRRLLSDMLEITIVCRRSIPNRSGQRGRDTNLWFITPLIQDLWEGAFSDKHQKPRPPKKLKSHTPR